MVGTFATITSSVPTLKSACQTLIGTVTTPRLASEMRITQTFLERGAGFPRIVQNQFELPFDQRIPILREAVAGPQCRTQLRSLSP